MLQAGVCAQHMDVQHHRTQWNARHRQVLANLPYFLLQQGSGTDAAHPPSFSLRISLITQTLCLMELYTRHSFNSMVAFIDLESGFDVAHRNVILDQLVKLGFRGQPIKCITGYFSNRRSRVLYKGVSSATKGFDLGSPQGYVLSSLLLNTLMHRLL